MTLSLVAAQADIRTRLATNFAQPAREGGVPMAAELQRINGLVVPHIVYNFTDLAPTAEKALAGVWFDGYMQAVNIYSIAPDMATAQALSLKVLEQFLGFTPSYSSPLRKRPGSGSFAIRSTNGADEGYIVNRSFTFTIDLVRSDVVAPGSVDNQDGTATAGTVTDNSDGTGTI